MMSDPLFSQLLLVGLLWLCLMLYVVWPDDVPACQGTAQALQSTHTISRSHPQAPLCRL